MPSHLFEPLSIFRYVTEPHAPTYRAIIQVLYLAKQYYVIELRPDEILARIHASGFFADLSDPNDTETLERRLAQLEEWGNLMRTHDTAAVSRIEDFERKRYLYHLTAIGEAAHRAVLKVEKTIGKSGSLQTSMLIKICDTLRDLYEHAALPTLDAALLVRKLHDLQTAFNTLTEEANRFISELNRYMSNEHMDEERFILHKHAVLAYISRFINELRRLKPQIADNVREVQAGIERIFAAAVESADLPPAIGDRDPRADWLAEWKERWNGVCVWFVGFGKGGQPTVDRLANVALNAVLGLMRTLERLNDQRICPVDLRADCRMLARWFAACRSDREAHRLWQASTGMYAARHFRLAGEDAEPAAPSTSWWDAPAVKIPVRLRTRGENANFKRALAAADHSRSKEWIAQRRRQERAQLDRAMRRFAGRGALQLSDVAQLDAAEFDLLLALLDEALAAPRKPDGTRAARTSDGRLMISLHPPEDQTAWVMLTTPRGTLFCMNYRIHVTDSAANKAQAGPMARMQGKGKR